ncbi:TonB-linked outer membrane protein, SusC/RagA family [Flavobacterium sp. 9AF]|uniref:SusC/RagA family TonB-linked outer membrane protein n=1 Tax=Flavobacterium sp. 9AF TaxID=2653142 RepID=UPI0012F1EE41|nr:TonB-dependent receptor [Flavobacterium sp. 9AF]VXB29398.1 TonB-linked outer membrane protein, SusC/RagA family [Flavobacterium sp. 9AF]
MKFNFKWVLTLIVAFLFQTPFAQEKTVTGTVSDAIGPLSGANVIVKGTKKGTTTNFDGGYTIKASEGDILVFSYVSFKNKEVAVTGTVINVMLEEDVAELESIVVVGYGTQKKSEVTGSVSQIKGDAIQGLVTPSFEGQLAGRASGVQITTTNGIIGQAPRIRIRGIASISSGTYPLIVIDGMPVYTGDIGGYANTNALGDINPNDIESYEVLKDGAATAIYGSRAANGVILITTKKGKKGTMQVNYNNVIGFASPVDTFDLLETPDFLSISNEKRTNRGQTAWAVGDTYNTDWQAAVLNKGALQMDHSLSFNGGTEKTKYFLSIGYSEQDGIAKSNSMVRYTMRTNIEHELNSWLTMGGGLSHTRTEYDGLNVGTGSLSGNIFNATRQLPNTPIYDANHPTGYNLSSDNSVVGQWDNTDPVGDNITNIVYVLDYNRYYSKVNRTMANFFASANLIDGLNLRIQASIDNPITSGFLYWNPVHGDGRGSNGRLQNDNTDLNRWNWQNILNYNKTFAEKHNVGATVVTEYQKQKNQYFAGIGTNLLDEFYNQNLVTGSYGTQESQGSVTENGIMSYIGRLNYNYDQKYFLQGSIRRDGLSQLPSANRWTTFTGYSAGWNIARESFMESINNIISEFKVRGSYAQVGNTSIGNYPYFGLTSASQYGTLNGIAFTQFGNDQLNWESSKKTDLGVDLAFLNNKLKLTADYFKNDIDGLILDVPTAPSVGVPNNTISKNIGTLVNKGYEFALEYNVINKDKLKWNINTNISFIKNEITSLPNGGADIIGTNTIVREGESINSLYGIKYWGVNPANGNPVYYKADGTLVQGNIPTSTYFVFDPNNPSDLSKDASLSATTDRVILGNTLPTYFGGFSSNLTYKNLDFNFLVRFSGGNKIFNSTRRDLVTQNLNNNSTEILGRWQSIDNPGDGVTPRLWASSNTFVNLTSMATSRFVEDGDFISLDNISIGYSLPKIVTDLIKVENFRFFIQAQNMLMITKYKGLNPEMETAGVDLNGTPRAKIVSMGVNVKL